MKRTILGLFLNLMMGCLVQAAEQPAGPSFVNSVGMSLVRIEPGQFTRANRCLSLLSARDGRSRAFAAPRRSVWTTSRRSGPTSGRCRGGSTGRNDPQLAASTPPQAHLEKGTGPPFGTETPENRCLSPLLPGLQAGTRAARPSVGPEANYSILL